MASGYDILRDKGQLINCSIFITLRDNLALLDAVGLTVSFLTCLGMIFHSVLELNLRLFFFMSAGESTFNKLMSLLLKQWSNNNVVD